MKKLFLILSIAFISCQSLRVGGNITSFSSTGDKVSVGFNLHGQGALKPKLDSLYNGYAINLAGQIFQITHTDTSFDASGILNFKTK